VALEGSGSSTIALL